MLSIRNLNGWFPKPGESRHTILETQVLYDISLHINKGETIALVGESGSGKTVTALTILRLLEESSGFRVEGDIQFEDKSLLNLPLDSIRQIRGNRISMIFQEPMISLNPVYTVGNQLIEPLIRHRGMDKSQALREALRILDRTGIVDPQARLRSYPHQLSGGQRQRVMIGMALSCSPSLLIADEPTTALDVSTQDRILELIKDIQTEYQMAMLLITHDLAMVRQIAERIYIMKEGRIVESGNRDNIFNNPENTYTRQLMAAIPQPREKFTQSGDVLLKTDMLSCQFKLHHGWKNLVQKKIKIVDAVNNVSLEIKRGTTCGIIGESGSGKTTLGLAILKLIKSSGSIVFNGCNLQALTRKELRQIRNRIQIVFQDPYSSLSPRMTVGDIVGEGLRIHHNKLSRHDRQKLVLEALEDVGLETDTMSRYPHEFSGGQRQRIAIARVIILRPELLILDEPTSALDMTIQAQIISLLQTIQIKYQLTYLFISHDLKVVRALADHIIVMQNGYVIEDGAAAEIFNNPQHDYTQSLFKAALKAEMH